MGRTDQAVNDQFDRLAASFRLAADREINDKRAETEVIIAVLEDKRAQVMSRQEAGYFILNWQEIDDRVRMMIVHDFRYRAIRCSRDTRRREAADSTLSGD
jgi:5-carboxymethyl-2-hydroxymuconate isomerase